MAPDRDGLRLDSNPESSKTQVFLPGIYLCPANPCPWILEIYLFPRPICVGTRKIRVDPGGIHPDLRGIYLFPRNPYLWIMKISLDLRATDLWIVRIYRWIAQIYLFPRKKLVEILPAYLDPMRIDLFLCNP